MSSVCDTVLFGSTTISFKLFFVNRRTMEIAVHPDKTVVVKAPEGTACDTIKKRVLKRAGWIVRQLDFFRKFDPRTPKRFYVGGESHLYLGRRYRLKIHRNQTRNEVKLTRGFFQVFVKGGGSPERVRQLMDFWYAQKAAKRFRESFERCLPSFIPIKCKKPSIDIRRMKKRWGSLSKNGRLTLNVDLIRAPKECIDYVITHELCHLKYHDHGPNFYRLIENVMPDWERRKTKLEFSLI